MRSGGKLVMDLTPEEIKNRTTAFTLNYFTQHFNLGLQAGLTALAHNADRLHQEAANLGASDLLNSGSLRSEIKLP